MRCRFAQMRVGHSAGGRWVGAGDSIGCFGPLPSARQSVPLPELYAVYTLLILCPEAPVTCWADRYNLMRFFAGVKLDDIGGLRELDLDTAKWRPLVQGRRAHAEAQAQVRAQVGELPPKALLGLQPRHPRRSLHLQ